MRNAFHIHKLEYIEPENVERAIKCIQKLCKLCKQMRSFLTEKRFCFVDLFQASPTTKARTLQAVPTDAGLEDASAKPTILPGAPLARWLSSYAAGQVLACQAAT